MGWGCRGLGLGLCWGFFEDGEWFLSLVAAEDG